jgi:modulator of FtsH protease HflK
MIKKIRAFAGSIMTSDGKGPWDSSPPDDGANGNKAGNKGGPKADDTSPDPKGPRNPWDPIPINSGGQKKRGPSLEDLLRRTGAGGGGGWGGLPRRSDGKSIWPMVAGGFALLWIFWTSVHQLQQGQEGVITTLGKYSRTVGSGISFTLPAPFEQMEKVDTKQIRTTAIGSPKPDGNNLILTKDQNIIDMAYEVRWSIKDPELYKFQLDQPDETVKEVAESAMRAAIANFDFNQANGPGRGEIEADVKKLMQDILNEYRAGIDVQSITILQSDPPAEVNAAFQEVNAAKQRRESYMNQARAYASQVSQLAQGETAEFDKIYEQYRQAPEVTKRRLYYETMEQVLGKVDKTIVETGGVTPYLPLPEFKKRTEDKPDEVIVTGAAK